MTDLLLNDSAAYFFAGGRSTRLLVCYRLGKSSLQIFTTGYANATAYLKKMWRSPAEDLLHPSSYKSGWNAEE